MFNFPLRKTNPILTTDVIFLEYTTWRKWNIDLHTTYGVSLLVQIKQIQFESDYYYMIIIFIVIY